jgi:hypothetical protein
LATVENEGKCWQQLRKDGNVWQTKTKKKIVGKSKESYRKADSKDDGRKKKFSTAEKMQL